MLKLELALLVGGAALFLAGVLMLAWSLTASVATLQPSPEVTGLGLINTGTTAGAKRPLQSHPDEIRAEDVTLMHVNQIRHN